MNSPRLNAMLTVDQSLRQWVCLILKVVRFEDHHLYTEYSPLSGGGRFAKLSVTWRVLPLIGWNAHTKPSSRCPLRQSLKGICGHVVSHLKGCILYNHRPLLHCSSAALIHFSEYPPLPRPTKAFPACQDVACIENSIYKELIQCFVSSLTL